MKSHTVHLGFEVGSADPVEIPIRHMAVTGQTQESGKTTALTGLILRAELPAVAFLTKRGEGEMPGRKILPYFQERADWRFVQSILESTMHEKMKFERAWIVRACQGASTLRDIQRNLVKLQAGAKNALSKDVYMLLGEYLQRVVPLIAKLPQGGEREMEYLFGEVHKGPARGLSVMDLTAYPLELQMLVISSTLSWIHQHANGVISIVPEAWKFIPQGRNTPVRIAAENLMREGAALKNYVWIDSQDMAGVDKILLRGCPVWLIGVQREALEIKRALANMPEGLKKPKAGDVATLELGQFYACFGKSILKTYVQPAWMDETFAERIATGELSAHEFTPPHTTNPKEPAHTGTGRDESPAGSPAIKLDSPVLRTSAIEEEEMPINQEILIALRMAIKDGAKETALGLVDGLESGNAMRRGMVETIPKTEPLPPVAFAGNGAAGSTDSEALYQAFKSRLIEESPGIIVSLTKTVPEIEVKELREKFTLDTATPEGRVAFLVADGFFDKNRINAEVVAQLSELGWPTLPPNVGRALGSLAEKGFLLQKEKGRYRAVEGMKVNIIRA